MPKKKLPIKKTSNLRAIAEADVTHIKLAKDGSYEPRKGKKGASHKIIESAGSVLAEPIGKAPKPPKDAGYGPPRFENEPARPEVASWHGPIPKDSTHAEYATSQVAIVVPIHLVDDFKDFRSGKLRFGRLRYNTDFISMMPGEEGEKTEGKQVVVRQEEPASPAPSLTTAGAATPAGKAPPAPRKPDEPGLFQNGVRKPGAGGKTAAVWDKLDQLLGELGRTPTKAEIIAAMPKDASAGMITTNHSYWRRFYGHQLAK